MQMTFVKAILRCTVVVCVTTSTAASAQDAKETATEVVDAGFAVMAELEPPGSGFGILGRVFSSASSAIGFHERFQSGENPVRVIASEVASQVGQRFGATAGMAGAALLCGPFTAGCGFAIAVSGVAGGYIGGDLAKKAGNTAADRFNAYVSGIVKDAPGPEQKKEDTSLPKESVPVPQPDIGTTFHITTKWMAFNHPDGMPGYKLDLIDHPSIRALTLFCRGTDAIGMKVEPIHSGARLQNLYVGEGNDSYPLRMQSDGTVTQPDYAKFANMMWNWETNILPQQGNFTDRAFIHVPALDGSNREIGYNAFGLTRSREALRQECKKAKPEDVLASTEEKAKPISPSVGVGNWRIGKDEKGIPFASFGFSDHNKLNAVTMYCRTPDSIGMIIYPKSGVNVKSVYFWIAGDGNELRLERRNIVNQKDWSYLAAEVERMERDMQVVRAANPNEVIDPSIPISVDTGGEAAYDFSGMTEARKKLKSMCKAKEPDGPLRYGRIMGLVALNKPCFLGFDETAISEYISRNVPTEDRERAEQELVVMQAEVERADAGKLFLACAGAVHEAIALGLRR
jgi:hypothetical protein